MLLRSAENLVRLVGHALERPGGELQKLAEELREGIGGVSTIVSTAIGVLVGGLITWVTAWYYYREATKDLKAEASRFSGIIEATFADLERSGWFRIRRDDAGRVISISPTLFYGRPGARTPPASGGDQPRSGE